MFTIDVQVTGTRHMHCDFCQGADRGTPESGTGALLGVMSGLAAAGVRRVNVSRAMRSRTSKIDGPSVGQALPKRHHAPGEKFGLLHHRSYDRHPTKASKRKN